MCVLMAFAIDSEVRGCHVNKDFWSAGIDYELPCSPKSAITKTCAITHVRFDTLKSLRDRINF